MLKFRATLPAIVAVLGAATIGACGSSSPRATASSTFDLTHAQIQRFQRDATKFTNCMRSHGVASFPDAPTQNDPNSGRTWKNAFQNQSPGFEVAARACQHLIPGTGSRNASSTPSHTEIAAMLRFARCIRTHGFTRFPDPESRGITHEMLAAAGINLHQPGLVQAADACVSVTNGYITRPVVARFIAGH